LSNDIILHTNNIISMIDKARQNTLSSINTELIKLYWNVGEYLSNESARSAWGDSFIDTLADQIQENYPEIKGFNRRGLYRMRQFFETYKDNEFGAVREVRLRQPFFIQKRFPKDQRFVKIEG